MRRKTFVAWIEKKKMKKNYIDGENEIKEVGLS